MAAPKCKECEFRKCEGKTFVTAGYPVSKEIKSSATDGEI